MENEQNQNLNTGPPSIETTVEPQPVKKPFFSKAIIAVFIIVIILILLPAGTYLFLNSNKQVACTTEAKICPDGSSVGRTGPKCKFTKCPTVTPTPDPASNAADATANWKTYNFSSEGINFKLPSTWNEYTFSGAGHPEKAHYFASSNPKNSDPKKESIEFGYLTRNLTYEELVNFYKANNAVNFPINEKLFIDGRECLFTASIKPLGQGSLASGIDTYLYAADCASKNNKQYTFSFSSRNQKDDQLFKIILSTFKFTDQTSQTDDTSTWKTYINTKNNYSFKYPNTYSLLKGPAENTPDEEFQKIDSVTFAGDGRLEIYVNPDTGIVNKKMECSSNEDCLKQEMAILKRTENNSKYVFKTIAGKTIKGIEYNIPELNQTFQDFIFIDNGNIWVISFTDKKITNTFDQILSTFKFTQ